MLLLLMMMMLLHGARMRQACAALVTARSAPHAPLLTRACVLGDLVHCRPSRRAEAHALVAAQLHTSAVQACTGCAGMLRVAAAAAAAGPAAHTPAFGPQASPCERCPVL